MSIWKAAAIWIVLLCGGGLGGWALRGRRDQQRMEEVAAQAFKIQLLTTGPRFSKFRIKSEPDPAPTPAEREAELRCIVYDPKAVAASATIRNVDRTRKTEGWTYDVELETPRSVFQLEWAGNGVPKVGQKGDLLGRISEHQAIGGTVPRLDPGWLEPIGTIARLDKRPRGDR